MLKNISTIFCTLPFKQRVCFARVAASWNPNFVWSTCQFFSDGWHVTHVFFFFASSLLSKRVENLSGQGRRLGSGWAWGAWIFRLKGVTVDRYRCQWPERAKATPKDKPPLWDAVLHVVGYYRVYLCMCLRGRFRASKSLMDMERFGP